MTPLLFDFDGTLVDSRRDLARGVNLLLADLELPALEEEQVVSFVGRGARSLILRCLSAVDPSETIPRDDPRLRSFLRHYRSVMLDTTVPFPGVVPGLKRLQRAGVPMAVVSNKPEQPTREIADALELTQFFPVIIGGDTYPERKPHAQPLIEAAKLLGVPLDRCVMVGDSDVDIAAAQAAGIPGFWCPWGGIHPDRPDSAVRSLNHFDDLVDFALGS